MMSQEAIHEGERGLEGKNCRNFFCSHQSFKGAPWGLCELKSWGAYEAPCHTPFVQQLRDSQWEVIAGSGRFPQICKVPSPGIVLSVYVPAGAPSSMCCACACSLKSSRPSSNAAFGDTLYDQLPSFTSVPHFLLCLSLRLGSVYSSGTYICGRQNPCLLGSQSLPKPLRSVWR